MRTLELGRAGTKTIYSLPNDILLLIIGYISVKDIITLRKVFYSSSHAYLYCTEAILVVKKVL
jgi:hypothetical protein